VPWEGLESWREQALAALAGEGPLADPLAWNVAAWLWFSGQLANLPAALTQARALLAARSGLRRLKDLR